LKKEHPKVRRLHGGGICDHYLVFTNRRLFRRSRRKKIPALLNAFVSFAADLAAAVFPFAFALTVSTVRWIKRSARGVWPCQRRQRICSTASAKREPS
jgi:hypothetical protein